MDFNEKLIAAIKKWWKELNLTIPQITIFAVLIFILGLILLSFTFILPVLAIGAAILIIAAAVYIIYKFLGGS